MQTATLRSITGWMVIGLTCLFLGGCKGCRPWNPFASEKDKEKKANVAVRPFSFQPIRPLPTDPSSAGLRPVKPGHVAELLWTVRANREDVRGTAELSLLEGRSSEPLVVPQTSFQLTFNRDVALPKGQDKQFRFALPLPPPPPSKQIAIQTRLYPRNDRRSLNLTSDLATTMPANQFFFVVLADHPDRYAFLKQLYSLRQPPFDLGIQDPAVYYQVMQLPAEGPLPLPQSPLAWTSIAYIVWDEIPWNRLTAEQQLAMQIWIHWGGQLLISGPNSLEALSGTDLAAWLPARSGGTRRLQQSDFAVINESWSIPAKTNRGRAEIEIPANSPLAGVRLILNEHGNFVRACGDLVAEAQIGRGRILVTAFPLDARPLINWRSFDGFVNSCLLRHPPRRYELLERIQPMWSFVMEQGREKRIAPDSIPMTRVNFFARDTVDSARIADEPTEATRYGWESMPKRLTGAASWNDGGPVARAAERALQEASGITVPDRSFVWRSLALYLLVLVPLNWGIFRLVGRVEWAWIATPLIAIVGAVWVVHEAQLNIGFARSRNEVAVLELHGNFRHGHLSRYTALYSSLSTSFDLEFDSPFAVAQPFRGGKSEVRAQRRRRLALWSDKKTRLTGFQVESNSTAMIHSEEFIDVGGSLAVHSPSGLPELRNGTRMKLRGAAVLRRDESGQLQGAWLGRLDPGASKRLLFRSVSETDPWFAQWDDESASREHTSTAMATPSVRALLRIALRNKILDTGEMRMVGWFESIPPGLAVAPRISQTTGVTFVVASLSPARVAEPRRDVNLYIDIVRDEEQTEATTSME